jgi:hypothetical protein
MDLNQLLEQAHQGTIEIDQFMGQLLDSQIFMPVTAPNDSEASEKTAPAGFQKSEEAIPLTLDTEDGFKVMVIFSDPQLSKEFLQDFPDYSGGFITEVPWMLERLGEGMGFSLNPGLDNGIDFDPDTVRQLMTLYHRQQVAE